MNHITQDSWNRVALTASALLLALFFVVPWSADVATDYGPDDPFTIVQHALFRSVYQYGRDIQFTHGPLAFWYQRHYWPSTYGPFIALHAVVALTLALAFVRAATAESDNRPIQWTLVVGFLALMSVDRDARIFVAVGAMALLHAKDLRLWSASMAVLLAIGCLAKISFLGAAAPVLLVLAFDDVLVRRRWPIALLVFVGATSVFWMYAKHDVAMFPAFLASAFDMSVGFTEAQVTYANEPSLPVLGVSVYGVAFLLLAGAYLTAFGWGLWREARWRNALFFLSQAAVVFMVWKATFVREDPAHLPHGYVTVASLAAMAFMLNWRAIDRWSGGRLGSRFAILGFGALVGAAGVGVLALLVVYPEYYTHKGERIRRNLAAASDYVFNGGRGLDAAHADALDAIGKRWATLPVDGQIAIVGTLQVVGLAKSWDLRPFPTLTHYAAWTQRLIARNADFFDAEDRPPNLLVDVEAIDGLSYWLKVRERYRPVGQIGPAERPLLQMTAADRGPIAFGETVRREVAFEEAVALPRAEALWFEGSVTPTLFGRIMALLYKTPRVMLQITYDDRSVGSAPFGPLMSEAGVAMPPRKILDQDRRVPVEAKLIAYPPLPGYFEPKVALSYRPIVLGKPGT